MAYTGMPGYYGVDEEESEMTLGFWYLFQETLWSSSPEYEEDDTDPPSRMSGEQWNVSRAVYSELIQVLRRKSVWPPKNILSGWPRGARRDSAGVWLFDPDLSQIRRTNSRREFTSNILLRLSLNCYVRRYRRDVGDTLLNA